MPTSGQTFTIRLRKLTSSGANLDILDITCECVVRDGSLSKLCREVGQMRGEDVDEQLVMAMLYEHYPREAVDARLAGAKRIWTSRHPVRAAWRAAIAWGRR